MSDTAPLNSCGCCEGISVEMPVAIYNRPGLPAIAYRVGTYAGFRESLLARLSDTRFSVLRQLRTRDNDDFTIALLDAWAVTGDVLTFYQERIANESYLRTATERVSILEQSRLLGYQLGPGVAANTHLAFTMEEAPGAPDQAAQPIILVAGIKVQSVPGPDELPQIFETIEAVEARPEWNAILPQLTEPQTLVWDIREIWVDGANLNLSLGDVVLIHAANESNEFDGSLRRVTKVESDTNGKRTRLALEEISDTARPVETTQPGVWVMRTMASPFGHNAPTKATYNANTGVFIEFIEWDLVNEPTDKITLSSRNEKILVGSWLVIEQDAPIEPTVEALVEAQIDDDSPIDDPGDIPKDDAQVEDSDVSTPGRHWTFSQVTSVTHLSVLKYGMAGSATRLGLSKRWKTNVEVDQKLSLLRSMTIAAQSEELIVAEHPLSYPVYGSTLALNGHVEGLLPGRPIAISGKRQRLRITSFAGTIVDFPDIPGFPDLPDIKLPPILNLDTGGIVFLKVGDVLAMAAPPMTIVGSVLSELTPQEFGAALGAAEPPRLRLQVIDRDGKTGRVDISAGEIKLVAAVEDDETIDEIAFMDDEPTTAIVHDRDRTTLQLASPLTNVYDRATMRINANVAAATHGESVQELLGSGDATLTYQNFTLRQPPLTYVSAETPSGSASTLKLYVNDVSWQEAPFFYGRGATERIYILRHDDDGRTTVQFGDGVTGARLPTGQNNVRAEYRKGSGLGGLVEARQLSQLLSRPLGLKEVINPEPAEGAEDAESRDDARQNAPTTVLTLDRVVSLQDYEDFSRTFAGIAKAQAVWVWDGRKRSIFLTVAGADGAVLEEDGAVIATLKGALHEYGDPFVAFTIKSYRQALFQIHGTVTIHVDHVIDTVLAAVTADLSQRYSFDTRQFGQSVALSEAIAAIQSIPGVVAVDIDQFYRTDATTPAIQPRLIADRPAMGADELVSAAELLTIDVNSLAQLQGLQ